MRCTSVVLPVLTVLLLSAGVVAQPGGGGARRDFISRPAARHVRVVTWNIGANSVFEGMWPGASGAGGEDRPARFRRVMKKLSPDVVCLQEILAPRTAADAARLFDDMLPLGNGQRWSAHGEGDAVIVSRYPLSMRRGRTEDYGGGVPRPHAMALVDLPNAFGPRDLYVLCAHFQAHGGAEDVRARQGQADAVAAWVRDLRTPGGEVELPRSTPVVLLGDWNAYRTDPAKHVETLLTGAIADEGRFGRGVAPDWDDSPLRDALPPHNAVGPETYTWGGPGQAYPPGELDRVLFTDSVLEMIGGFVLNTVTLSPGELSVVGLQKDDVMRSVTPRRVYDHLPVVVDLAPRAVR